MKLLVAADIFGDTPELHSVAKEICDHYAVVSPYENPQRQFSSEKHAYTAFLSSGGIRSYVAKLASEIDIYKPDALVGFSAGATAGWIVLSDHKYHEIQLGILFYGSRIRDHLHLRPRCTTKLFFAEHERSFEAKQLTAALRELGLSADICAGCQHGFMNQLSTGHDSSAEKMGVELIKSALHGLTKTPAIHSHTDLGPTA